MPADRARARTLAAIAAKTRALSSARGDAARGEEAARRPESAAAAGAADAMNASGALLSRSRTDRRIDGSGGRGRAGVRCEDRLDRADAPGDGKERSATGE